MAPSDTEIIQRFRDHLRTVTGLTAEEFAQLSHLLRAVRFAKGAIVLEPGSVCAHAFHVTHGLLRVATLDKDGNEHIVQFAPEGWYASDRSNMYFQEPSHLRIDAIEDTAAVMVGQVFVDAACALSPPYAKANTTLLHNHIRHMQDRIALLLGARAEERYQKFIAIYPDLTMRVPQRMIASYLGITPESLSRVRRELAERNFKPRT